MQEMRGDAALGRQPTAGFTCPLSLWDKAVALFEATKFRSVILLGFVGVAAGLWALRLVEDSSFDRLALATIAVVLASMGANAVTGGIDYRMDSVMSRTRHRPCPTGRLTPAKSMAWGIALILVGAILAALTGSLWSAGWVLLGAANVALLYNGWSKARTPWSVVLGSPAGGAPVMALASAVLGTAADPRALLLAALVAVWTPVHVWSLAIRYVDDYRAAGVPMLPVVIGVPQAARCVGWTSLALCGVAAAIPAALSLAPGWTVFLLALQAPILISSAVVVYRPSGELAWLLFKITSPYLALVFVVVAIAGGA